MDGHFAATDVLSPEGNVSSLWSSWVAHFERQRLRPLPLVGAQLDVPPATLRALVASLARFQLGETGEGRIVREIERFRAPGIDGAYRRALELFIREEGRHARILRDALSVLGAPALKRDWTAQFFTHGRRLCGVRFKLLVLLTAEVVAVVAYGALAKHLPASSLREALEQLRADEVHHVAFHGDFFRTTLSSELARHGFAAALSVLLPFACAIVLVEHRAVWRALGVSRRELMRDARAHAASTIAHVRAVGRAAILFGR